MPTLILLKENDAQLRSGLFPLILYDSQRAKSGPPETEPEEAKRLGGQFKTKTAGRKHENDLTEQIQRAFVVAEKG
jgi:hypothetical protein